MRSSCIWGWFREGLDQTRVCMGSSCSRIPFRCLCVKTMEETKSFQRQIKSQSVLWCRSALVSKLTLEQDELVLISTLTRYKKLYISDGGLDVTINRQGCTVVIKVSAIWLVKKVYTSVEMLLKTNEIRFWISYTPLCIPNGLFNFKIVQ